MPATSTAEEGLAQQEVCGVVEVLGSEGGCVQRSIVRVMCADDMLFDKLHTLS
jgi:hypothetical protein